MIERNEGLEGTGFELRNEQQTETRNSHRVTFIVSATYATYSWRHRTGKGDAKGKETE